MTHVAELEASEHMFDRMEAAPNRERKLSPGPHPQIAITDWRATVNGTRTCMTDGCDVTRIDARGMCSRHYGAWRKNPTFEAKTRFDRTDAELRADELVRFNSKFVRGADDECWPWLASIMKVGYGQFENKLSSNTAHRFSLTIAVGPPPQPNMDCCHTCDFRPCVNPNHLYWGTRQQNVDDARSRGRIPLGEAHANSLLTKVSVAEIKSRARNGEMGTTLAREFGVHPNTIYSILRGDSWRHVK